MDYLLDRRQPGEMLKGYSTHFGDPGGILGWQMRSDENEEQHVAFVVHGDVPEERLATEDMPCPQTGLNDATASPTLARRAGNRSNPVKSRRLSACR